MGNNLILFNVVFTKLQDAFYRFKRIKIISICSRSKSDTTTGSLWKEQTKTENSKKGLVH